MVPSDCSQVSRALRSAHAVAAGGQDRRAPGLSTGLLAAFAAYGTAAGGLGGGGGSIAARLAADILAADMASGSDTTPDTAVSGRRAPCQPAAVVNATIRIARTASQSVRCRPRAYLRQRRSHTDSMLSAPPAARPASRDVNGQPVMSPRHGTNLSDRTRASGRLAGK